VLIIGASGGVGSFAVQIAKAFEAVVTGVAGTAKVEAVRALGADHVIDYSREDATDGRHRYDVVLDIGGLYPAGSRGPPPRPLTGGPVGRAHPPGAASTGAADGVM
jgi:Zinc-binding dehydrogenase